MANSKLMLEGRLDADEFLKRIVYQQSQDDFGMLDVTLINVLIDHDDDEDSADEIGRVPSPTPSTQSTASSQSVGRCALCDEERAVTSAMFRILCVSKMLEYFKKKMMICQVVPVAKQPLVNQKKSNFINNNFFQT